AGTFPALIFDHHPAAISGAPFTLSFTGCNHALLQITIVGHLKPSYQSQKVLLPLSTQFFGSNVRPLVTGEPFAAQAQFEAQEPVCRGDIVGRIGVTVVRW